MRFSKSHVASGDVFCDSVGEQNWVGSRRVGNGLGLPPVIRWREVRPSNPDISSIHHRQGEKSEPVNVWIGIVVDERYDLPIGHTYSCVACFAEPAILSVDETNRVV